MAATLLTPLGSLLAALASSVLLLLALVVVALFRLPRRTKGVVAFFHPFADGGGGGERVLWCAVQAVHAMAPQAQIVIYAREGVEVASLVADAQRRFNVDLSAAATRLQVVPLKRTALLLPERYPRLTLLGQAWGSVRVGHEALGQLVPEVFIDTTGWAFTYPLARLAGARVASYTHYPTVSTNMISRVASRESTYNNDSAISRSSVLSAFKLLYYRAVALLYGACGGTAEVVMCNSSWTRRHVSHLFWSWRPPLLVYPPCDTEQLQQLPLDRSLKQLFIVSVAQFRPEKNHRLQLEAFAMAKARAGDPTLRHSDVLYGARLKMVGGCRNEDDARRLEELKQQAQELGVADSVDWCVNAPFSELQGLLGEAVAGLHTMRDEHFGISVVEYMAAGAVPIAHNSAGPQEDIVVEVAGEHGEPQVTGFLATTPAEYAQAIVKVLVMDQRERLRIAAAGQRHASSFSGARFAASFTAAMQPLLKHLAPAGAHARATGQVAGEWSGVMPTSAATVGRRG